MSSVNSSSDRSKNGDEVRRTREAYQEKEVQANKKQAQQLKKITEAHYGEVQSLRDDHAASLEELKNTTREALSRRDLEYQKDITELRDLHQKQVQRVAYDADERQHQSDVAHKSDSEKLAKTNEQQVGIMRSTFEKQIRAKDQQFEENTKTVRAKAQEDDSKRVDRMTKTFGENTTILVKDRDERLGEKQKNFDGLRTAKDLEINRLKRHSEMARDVMLKDHALGISGEREDNRLAQQLQRENLAQGIERMRDRYGEATEKMRLATEEARDGLSDSVNKRMNNKLSALEQDNARLRADQTRNLLKSDGQKEIELANLKRSMQANITKLEEQRQLALDASNGKSTQEIDRANKKNVEALHTNDSFYKEKISMDSLKAEERMARVSADADREIGQEKVSNNGRFAKLKSFNEVEQEKMRAYFERAANAMKENFENTLRDVRDHNKRDQEGLFKQFTKQAQENDVKFQEKFNEMSVRYERQLAVVQDQHIKDVKDMQKGTEHEKTEISKRAVSDLESQAAKFEYRIGKMEDAHKREIEAVNRKHQETLANLTKVRQS